jgi:hypothetical protein
MAPATLAGMLRPCSPEEFLASTWGQTFRHFPGSPDKFQALLPWPRLNAILQESPPEHPRLRVILDGAGVSPKKYLYPARTLNNQPVPRLNPAKLDELLRQGALLIVDSIEAMVPAIGRLTESLERSLHEPFQASLYAAWGRSAGPEPSPHIDEGEVFVLQISGRKRWKIFGPAPEVAAGANGRGSPPAEPIWDHVLEAGDLLYFPRGWWHVALPLSEPTLHVSFACRNRTGLDFLQWLQQEVRSDPLFHRDLPRFGSKAEQADHMRGLREAFLAAWDDGALQRYLAVQDGLATPRSRFSLPWSALPNVLPPTDEATVQWTAPRLAFPTNGSGGPVIEVWANGEKWHFARAAEVVLRPLMDAEPHSIAEVCEGAADTLDPDQVRSFLAELLTNGLIAVVGD